MNGKTWRHYCLHPEWVRDGNSIKLLRDGEEALPAMLDAVRKASSSVLLEVYSIAEDDVGGRFARALAEKAASGAQVYLIFDAVGSLSAGGQFFESMRAAGVNIGRYHPLAPWKPHWNWFRRNHRKMLITDNARCFIGGVNLTHEHGPAAWGGLNWRDAAARIEGPCVDDAVALFWESWRRCRQPVPDDFRRPGQSPAGEMRAMLASSSGIRDSRSIRKSYRHAIGKAKEHIYIANAYFLPGAGVLRGLIKAARRGVKVAVIVPGQTDHPYVRWASWAFFKKLLKSGVKIYEWKTGVLHAKTAVIDGIWSSVGSHNLDHRSLYYNLEVNINVLDESFGGEMKTAFERDLSGCSEITLETVRAKPPLFKAASKILYLLRNFL